MNAATGKMPRFFRWSLFASMTLSAVARACDLCGCYTPQMEAMTPSELSALGPMAPGKDEHGDWLSRVYVALADQFTHFGTLQLDGEEVDNPTGQFLSSSITQVVGGYSFNS